MFTWQFFLRSHDFPRWVQSPTVPRREIFYSWEIETGNWVRIRFHFWATILVVLVVKNGQIVKKLRSKMPKSVLIIGLMTKNYRFSNKNGRTSQKWLNFDLKPLFVLNNFNFTKQKKPSNYYLATLKLFELREFINPLWWMTGTAMVMIICAKFFKVGDNFWLLVTHQI